MLRYSLLLLLLRLPRIGRHLLLLERPILILLRHLRLLLSVSLLRRSSL